MKRVVNAIVVNFENKILIIKRKSGLHKGKWAFPGGVVKKGESDAQALARELKEETNIELKKIVKIVGNYSYPRKNGERTQGKSYLVIPKNTSVKINSEILDFKWVSVEELENLDTIHGLEDEALEALYS